MPGIMEQEILSQPRVCAGLIQRQEKKLRLFTESLRRRPPAAVVMAARGSSDHAAIYGRYLLEYLVGVPVSMAAPSLFTTYHRPPRLKDCLVIGVSQSGQGPDICAVLDEARRQGGRTLALTNDPSSPLAAGATEFLDLSAGLEKAVAATKTYTAELAGLAMLAALWTGDKKEMDLLRRVPGQMAARVKAYRAPAFEVAETYVGLEAGAVLGRGFHLANAQETALKMKECANLPMLAYSTADFAHGPVSLARAGYPVFVLGAPGASEKDCHTATLDLLARGARVFRLGLADRYLKKLPRASRLDTRLVLPDTGCPERYSPLLTILPGQWLALAAAMARGLDPANPRGLKKITKTR